jgi:nitrate reductase beta subunit
MKIKAQYAMVLNLDKCIGCHCAPAKRVDQQRAQNTWFNNETNPASDTRRGGKVRNFTGAGGESRMASLS